ncbi:neuronal-specific septin-3 isoform X3 [Marmota monax]|uniref:neuronal-specific septin-3 isoform X3 n=1 Tax=Marmota monax TaxID=9995 RepID=UPI001EB00503|nr:neuronal-specific septin-3 isoform X3 [Marmota monax]
MDNHFAPAPPEMQPHGASGSGTSFSRSNMLGRHPHPSRLPGGVSPLIPVIRKTVHLDAFPKSHVPQTSSRLGLRARTLNVPQQDTGIAPGAVLSPLPANSLVPRKLSSISLTIHHKSQARSLNPQLSHWEELHTLGREAATHGGGRLSAQSSAPMTIVSEGRVHSEGPGNPGLLKPSRMPTVEKPLMSSYLALPFQSRLTQSSSSFAGPGLVGQGHIRASAGRGKSRSRGIPRPRLLQRATPAMNLAVVGTTRPDTARHLATMATNRSSLATTLATTNTSRWDTGTEFPALDTKLDIATDLSTTGTTKPGKDTDLITTDPEKLGRVMVIADKAKPDKTSGDPAMVLTIPDPVKLGTARPDTTMALVRANKAKLGTTMDSPTLDTSSLGTATDPATGELDIATYPLMPSIEAAQDHPTMETVTDQATKPVTLDLAREFKGQSGLGKSTLVNTLFKSQVSRKASSWNREEKIPKTVEIKAIGHVIEEGGVKMKLTVIDTPGFGDQINNENCWEPIEKYINEQYEKFLKEEVNIARKKRIPDTRVHCCLYFISPTGHSLRPLDLEFMKHLSKVVNIIPVIAKADTMTLEEKSEFKQRVRKELEVNGIEFYPQKEFDEDLEDKTENDKIRQESMPFAVVGSDKEYQVNGKRVLGRKTPWGIIEVENLNHCEFALLRDFVIRTHLQDLKEVTHNIHYETYRAKRLNDNGGLPPGEGLLGTVLPPVPATPCPTAE